MAYLNSAVDHSLEAFVGDYIEDIHAVHFSDADYASELRASKSTSGGYIALIGPHTFVPLMAVCNKQTATCHSSTESEIVALEVGLRTGGLQLLIFWGEVFWL